MQEVESRLSARIMLLESQAFNAEQKATKVRTSSRSTCTVPISPLFPFSSPSHRLAPARYCRQFQRLYETKAEADADKARQIRELSEENSRTMERVRRGNNTDLKKEASREQGPRLQQNGAPQSQPSPLTTTPPPPFYIRRWPTRGP